MKKYTMLFSIFLLQVAIVSAQEQTKDKLDQSPKMKNKVGQAEMNTKQVQLETWDNFDGVKSLYYGTRSGTLDTLAENPAGNMNNNDTNRSDMNRNNNMNNDMGQNNNVIPTGKCGKYVRSGKTKFDYIKMNLKGKLIDVNSFATYSGIPPKMKMKVYSTAPAGTLIEIQLGKKSNTSYPAGTNSQYQAYTTKTGAWEELEFKYSQTPKGSETSTTNIDQITLLFNPGTSTSDTYYFDDIMGPALVSDKTVSAD